MAKYNIEIKHGAGKSDPYIVTPPSQQALQQAINKVWGYDHVNVISSDTVIDKTAEGKPIFMELSFERLSYTDDKGNPVSVSSIYIPCAVVEISLQKKIVKTEIAGAKRRGTVKEQIGTTDYAVNIKGLIVGSDGLYPREEVQKLRFMAEAPIAVGINHDLLLYMGITHIVIESIDFPNKQGFQNVQPFSISATSDEPYELKYTTEQEAKKQYVETGM